MSFQAKVKKTAQLFVATNEVDKDRAWGKDARKPRKANPMSAIYFPLCPSIPLRRGPSVNLHVPFLKAMPSKCYLSV